VNKKLHVEIINPANDNYALTPAKKLSLGEVDFAIAPLRKCYQFEY
jgi:hypothetical protein